MLTRKRCSSVARKCAINQCRLLPELFPSAREVQQLTSLPAGVQNPRRLPKNDLVTGGDIRIILPHKIAPPLGLYQHITLPPSTLIDLASQVCGGITAQEQH